MRGRQLPVGWLLVLIPLWGFVCFLMLVSILAGLGCVILGMISLFVDLSGALEMQLGGEVVRTTEQKVHFMEIGALMAVAGIAFWWLHWRGYVGRALIFPAILLGLFLTIWWLTGSTNIISVGG
jgi:hypothetical protein